MNQIQYQKSDISQTGYNDIQVELGQFRGLVCKTIQSLPKAMCIQ